MPAPPLLHAWNQPQIDGSIETMSTLDHGARDRNITVEVSNRRLPLRMVAGRLRNDLRHPGDILHLRTRRNGRLAMMVVAVLVMPIVGLTRSTGKPGSSAL